MQLGIAYSNSVSESRRPNPPPTEVYRTIVGRLINAIKCLLAAVGLSVALLTPQAHANCVGFANVAMTNGYNFIANPVSNTSSTNGNSLTNLFSSGVPDGTLVYLWDISSQAFTAPAIYSTNTSSWSTNFSLPVGRGFVLKTTKAWTNTFVGDIVTGNLTNFFIGNNNLSLLGALVPISTNLVNLFFPKIDGENVYTFKPGSQTYSDAFSYFSGWGWFDPIGAVNTNGPVINVGQSFFVQNPRPDTNWVVNFSCGLGPLNAALPDGSSSHEIQSLSLSADSTTLNVNLGGAYDVEFSTDGLIWTKVATKQTGNIWRGPRPSTPQGFYRVTTR